jgi:hypothetical protein
MLATAAYSGAPHLSALGCMDQLPRIETFFQFSAAVAGVLGLVYTIFGMFRVAQAIRLAAILLVASLSLFANSTWTYFAAIFIIATAITELEFLEKLAAIIRGSKEYFDYKKSQVPIDEAKAKAAAEASSSGALGTAALATGPEPTVLLPSGDAAGLGYAVEQLALTYLEQRLGAPIQRNVRFSTPRATVEFDGVIERSGGRSDTVVEVKFASEKTFEDASLNGAKALINRKDAFKDMTGRRTTGVLVVVVPDKKKVLGQVGLLKARVQGMSHTLQFEVVDFPDIGFTGPHAE